MRTERNLASLDWQLTGWTPYLWRQSSSMETGATAQADISPIPARVPGSVQHALRAANIIPNWNMGLNARLCEWVENRHWVFEARIPDEWLADAENVRLCAKGLDDRGWVYLNGREVGQFKGTFVPHSFELSGAVKPSGNTLSIVFDCPPRWLGQCGYTSQMKEWRPRFNYTWDWTSRLVQIGIWDDLTLEVTDGVRLGPLRTAARLDIRGATLDVQAEIPEDIRGTVHIWLSRSGAPVTDTVCSPAAIRAGITLSGFEVERWWPNGQGDQALYDIRVELRDAAGRVADRCDRRIGFRDISWQPCEGAPSDSDPWICVVNGTPVFLQGVNWTPIRPNFADVSTDEYYRRLTLYRDLGVNVLRVWGGAFLEKSEFYDICDELGLMVWQEFPLSSSGLENWPPEDHESIESMERIARSYIGRRSHHPCLILWSGGNELQGDLDGGKAGCGKPCDLSHPMLARLADVVAADDSDRRFVATSASGPRFTADEQEFGLGVHWDVHGPWGFEGEPGGWWSRYWANDDALFRSEAGAPGASPLDIIELYRGACDVWPATEANPLWRRTSWWIEWPQFVAVVGREPRDLEEYITWSQARQGEALAIAARACKGRFPRCGGFIVWMGHDSFPCTANTAIVDFEGRPKPAAIALAEVFREP